MAQTPRGSIGGFVMDVTVMEDHVKENEVTEDPVEEGAAMTNHIRRKSDMLTLQCAVTDHPMGEMVTVRSKREAALATLNAAANSLAPVSTSQPVDPYGTITEECRAYMDRLIEDREPVVVVTSIRTYDSMALISFRESRTPDTGESMQFTAVLKKIRIVSNERSSSRVAVPRAAKKKNRGHLPTVPTVDQDEAFIKKMKALKRHKTDEENRLIKAASRRIYAQGQLDRYKEANADWYAERRGTGHAEDHF